MAPLPQLRAEQISFAPNLFRTKKLKARELATVTPAYLLQELSFSLFAGDRVALVGASGSGKTTLLRLLNRLSEPIAGKLYFEEQAYAQLPVIQLRQAVALVPQESKLLGMTVEEALSYPLHLRGIPKKLIHQRITDWREQLRLPSDWLNRTETQLSVGQRQWVAIARSLIAQPKVLLLDEPTSALDVGRAETLLESLVALNQRDRTTIVMVNHQLDLAQRFAQRVLVLQQGRLTHDQPVDQIHWQTLTHQLKVAELQQTEEWDG